MTPAEQDAILRGAGSSRYPRELAVFEQDAEAHSFFVLLDGHVRVVRTTPDGQQIIARYIGGGRDIRGCGGPRPHDLSGKRDRGGRLRRAGLAERALAGLSSSFPAFGANTFKTVGGRLQRPRRGWSRCRPSRSSSGSRTRC